MLELFVLNIQYSNILNNYILINLGKFLKNSIKLLHYNYNIITLHNNLSINIYDYDKSKLYIIDLSFTILQFLCQIIFKIYL